MRHFWFLLVFVVLVVVGCGVNAPPRTASTTQPRTKSPPPPLVPKNPKITEAKAIKAEGLELRAKLQDLAKGEGAKVRNRFMRTVFSGRASCLHAVGHEAAIQRA